MSSGEGGSCGKLPFILEVCPTCSAGIKPALGWTWIDTSKLFEDGPCGSNMDRCTGCALGDPRDLGPVGLLWIGVQFYARPADFIDEVNKVGFSRRISQVPKAFVVGETWVLVAHRKAVEATCPDCEGSGVVTDESVMAPCDCKNGKVWMPAIFGMFKPDRIEVVVDDSYDDARIEALIKRGLEPVKVVRLDEEEG